MRRIAVLCLVLLWAGPALADGKGSTGAGQQITCATSTTALDAKDSQRVSWLVQLVDTAKVVRVCPASTCTATTGLILDSTTRHVNSEPEEHDGPISCIAIGTSADVVYMEILK